MSGKLTPAQLQVANPQGERLEQALARVGGDASRLADAEPLIRGAAIWALRRLDPERGDALALAFLPEERDPDVRTEWRAALT